MAPHSRVYITFTGFLGNALSFLPLYFLLNAVLETASRSSHLEFQIIGVH
jgi:glycopeptide antibiotics resistance protein